jgi:hypothetical protein
MSTQTQLPAALLIVSTLLCCLLLAAQPAAAAATRQQHPQQQHQQQTSWASSSGNHTSNWAVLVATSKYWYNYRHMANTLSFYRTVKRLGIPGMLCLFSVGWQPLFQLSVPLSGTNPCLWKRYCSFVSTKCCMKYCLCLCRQQHHSHAGRGRRLQPTKRIPQPGARLPELQGSSSSRSAAAAGGSSRVWVWDVCSPGPCGNVSTWQHWAAGPLQTSYKATTKPLQSHYNCMLL